MIPGSLPRRYARALFSLATDEGQLEEVWGGLEKMTSALVTDPSILQGLGSQSYLQSERLKAMEEIADHLKIKGLVTRFLLLLIQRERISLLPQITREFLRMKDEREGIVRAKVWTPTTPSKGLLTEVEEILQRVKGQRIIAEGVADSGMLGGITLQVGHTIYDGSVRRRLERMREKMIQEPFK